MSVKVIECPRDAMQGIKHPISTAKKVQWMQLLLQCGFDTLDCGSFVSAQHVPQMADTAEVLQEIAPLIRNGGEKNKLLVIVANERGAQDAVKFDTIDFLGFPFSINETFQLRNTNAGTDEAFVRLQNINHIAQDHGKKTVAYLSMAFGNPYGEIYDREKAIEWADKIADLGIETISLADTVGTAKIEDVDYLFSTLTKRLPRIEWGAHFHALPGQWTHKIETAYNHGCRRFDGAILGLGGCPMATDELTGNTPTEGLVQWLQERDETGIDMRALNTAVSKAMETYG